MATSAGTVISQQELAKNGFTQRNNELHCLYCNFTVKKGKFSIYRMLHKHESPDCGTQRENTLRNEQTTNTKPGTMKVKKTGPPIPPKPQRYKQNVQIDQSHLLPKTDISVRLENKSERPHSRNVRPTIINTNLPMYSKLYRHESSDESGRPIISNARANKLTENVQKPSTSYSKSNYGTKKESTETMNVKQTTPCPSAVRPKQRKRNKQNVQIIQSHLIPRPRVMLENTSERPHKYPVVGLIQTAAKSNNNDDFSKNNASYAQRVPSKALEFEDDRMRSFLRGPHRKPCLIENKERSFITTCEFQLEQQQSCLQKVKLDINKNKNWGEKRNISELMTSNKLDYKDNINAVKSKVQNTEYEQSKQIDSSWLKIEKKVDLSPQIEDMALQLKEKDQAITDLQNDLLKLERRSRSRNLRFGGIGEDRNEDTLSKLQGLIRRELRLDGIKIEHAHRVGKKVSGSPRHIIATFKDIRQMNTVLTKTKALKCDWFYAKEDLAPADLREKQKYKDIMAKAYAAGHHPSFRDGVLYIDGKPYFGDLE